MGQQIYLNGKLIPREEAVVSVYDHGLLYGDGVFEGIRSYNNRIFKLDEHLDRLYNSATGIMLEIPMTKEELKEAIRATLRANKLADAYIRLVVTRGVGDLGLDPRKCTRPTIFIIVDKISLYPPEYYQEGLEILTVPTVRNIPQALNPQIKSLNYLNNILAKVEANNQNIQEALMLNSQGYIAECTGENIFVVKSGVLFTPPEIAGVLKGITRATVIEIALTQNLTVKEELFTRFDLYISDECFLTGTAAEIVPVTKIDGRVIGAGKPGPITKILMKEFRKLTETTGTSY